MKIILLSDIKSGNLNPISTCFKNNFKIVKKMALKHENTFFGYCSIVKIDSNDYNLYYRCIVENELKITSAKNLNNKNIYKMPDVSKMYTQGITCVDKLDNKLNITYPKVNIIHDESLDEEFNNAILKENCACHNLSFFYDEKEKNYKGIGGLVFNITEIVNFAHITGFDNEYFKTVPVEKIVTKSLHENPTIIQKNFFDKYRMNGLYLYESSDGFHWNLKQDTPIIGGLHDGTLAMRNSYNEFDSNICCFYWKKFNKYFLYTRSNISNGKRFIQVSTSKNLINWKHFQLIQLEPEYEFTLKENYYSYNIFEICNGEYLLAYLPCCEYTDTNISSVKNNKFKFFVSEDGFNFTNIYEKDIPGTKIYYPATGYIRNNKIINIFQLERIHIKEFMYLKKRLEKIWNVILKHKNRNFLTPIEFMLFLRGHIDETIINYITPNHYDDLIETLKNKKIITFDILMIEIYKYIMTLVKYEINELELSYLCTGDGTEKFVILKDLYDFPHNNLIINSDISTNGYIIIELLDDEFKPINKYNRHIFNKIESGTQLCKWNSNPKINSGTFHIKIYMLNSKLYYLDGLSKVKSVKLYNGIQYTVIYFDKFHFFPGKFTSICDPQIDSNIKNENAIQKITKTTEYDNIIKLRGGVKYLSETSCVQKIKLDNNQYINIPLIDGTEVIRVCNLKLVNI
jgi:hypothetical protein